MKKDLKAFILCGGEGKRLRPLTDKVPKPLLEIKKNFTILDKQLLDFKKAGIKEVYLLTSYLSNKIKRRYGNYWQGLSIRYPKEEKPMGTLGALKNFLKEIENDLIGINGDIISDYNISRFIEYSQNSDNLIILVVTKLRSPYGILELEDKKITSFIEKPLLDFYINTGIYYLKKESYPYFLKKYSEKDIERTVFPELAEKGLIGYYYEDVFWESIDSIKDLEKVRQDFKTGYFVKKQSRSRQKLKIRPFSLSGTKKRKK